MALSREFNAHLHTLHSSYIHTYIGGDVAHHKVVRVYYLISTNPVKVKQ